MKNPNAKQPSPKPSLMYLLAWAKKNKRYIEIYCPGSAQVQWGDCFEKFVDGDTLYQALVKAHKDWKENK